MSSYTAFSVLVICIFISTVSVADGEDFLISATTGVVRNLCLTPGLPVCLFLPLAAKSTDVHGRGHQPALCVQSREDLCASLGEDSDCLQAI